MGEDGGARYARLLLVEPNATLNSALDAVIQTFGCFLIQSELSYEGAARAIDDSPPDVLLLSLSDGHVGLDLIRRQRQLAPASRIIAMSLSGRESEAAQAGCDVFLRRPFLLEELEDALGVAGP